MVLNCSHQFSYDRPSYFPLIAAGAIRTALPHVISQTKLKKNLKTTRHKSLSREAELPDFDHPPAVETFIGFHFANLQNWKTPYFGLFWQEIRDEYPDAEVLPPIPSEE